MNLEFKLENQILKRTDNETIVARSKNFYKCKFQFDEEFWDNLNKFAIFEDSWGKKTTVHLGNTIGVLSCIIPDFVLKGTFFKVSVYGGDLITTNTVSIPLTQSGYGRNNHSCNKDIFVEIFDKLDSKIEEIGFSDNALHIFNDGELVDSICLDFANETQIKELMQEQMDLIDSKLSDYVKVENIAFVDGLLIFQ